MGCGKSTAKAPMEAIPAARPPTDLVAPTEASAGAVPKDPRAEADPAAPPDLAALQRAFEPSEAQRAAAEAAAAEHQARVAAAEDAVPPEKRSRTPAEGWAESGGRNVEGLLQHTELVDARYLISLHKHGGIVPRCQDLPPAARIGPKSVWRLTHAFKVKHFTLPVLALSYPWLDAEHPDRLGEMLARIVPILVILLEGRLVGSKHSTIGVMWDYCCLPQHPRTELETQRFKASLREINAWYAHPFVYALLMTAALPSGAEYANQRPYEKRGWCHMEKMTCLIAKYNDRLLDYAAFDPAKNYDEDALVQALRSGRAPPVAPDTFAAELRRSIAAGEMGFTAGAVDVEVVIELYQRMFVRTFERYAAGEFGDTACNAYTDQGWGPEEGKILAAAMMYVADHCNFGDGHKMNIFFRGNDFGSIKKDIEAADAAAIECFF